MSEQPSPPRVLVVDAVAELASLTVEALSERGFLATAAFYGRDALRRIRDETFDALVTELRVPQVDGLTLLGASRAHDPTRPVIVVTGHGALDTAMEAIRMGAYCYLVKPVRNERLASLLCSALNPRGSDGFTLDAPGVWMPS